MDDKLCGAARRAAQGLVDADLGGGLVKQRVARPGQGRSGGYRTLIAFRMGTRTSFIYGFAKSERGNIGPDELGFWRKVASGMLAMNESGLDRMVAAGEVLEIFCNEATGLP